MNKKVCILGTGAWATALGCCLSSNNLNVYLWGINQSQIDDLNNGFNREFFGNKKLFANVFATNNLELALKDAFYILIAVPSTFIINVLDQVKNYLEKAKKYIFINVAKGLDEKTNNIWSISIKETLKDFNIELVTLIGPSFAIDVFDKKPTIVNVISKDIDTAKLVSNIFNLSFFKAIVCDDESGAEVLAALKNLLAIAIGISVEQHNSINTTSALLTEGVSEMQLIAKVMCSKENTILQFCGIGDIFLTCTSDKSRNFTFGRNIFKFGVQNVIKENKLTVEGYKVFPIAKKIIESKNLNAPLFKLIIDVLENKLNPNDFVSKSLEHIITSRHE